VQEKACKNSLTGRFKRWPIWNVRLIEHAFIFKQFKTLSKLFHERVSSRRTDEKPLRTFGRALY